jgi:2-C-methyl-D-erythritol 4-phosphate cytidylyltransferase
VFVSAIIPAAGVGRRFGSGTNKQFLSIAGKPILYYSIQQFQQCPLIDEIIVVVPPEWIAPVQTDIIMKYEFYKVSRVVQGGRERFNSVENGLNEANPATKIVAIHDGVRPLVSVQAIEKVVVAAQKDEAAILAVPVKDTVKIAKKGYVHRTLDRNQLWAIQTPQVFKYDLIKKAYVKKDQLKMPITDDAMLVEALGHPVKVVEGEYTNIKITSPDDFSLAEYLIMKQTQESCC